MINVTDGAKTKIQELLEKEGGADFLRVAVKAGGCSGLSYDLSFSSDVTDSDQVFQEDGVTIVTDTRSLLYLMNMTLDFSDGINGKGFEFSNPNATRTCGCGESFSL
jgi:iron-sulfur cluster assembly protein